MNVQVTIGTKIYKLELNQKYTVVIGDSGTGKTTLARLIDDGYADVQVDRDMGYLALINTLHPEEYPSTLNKGKKVFPWHNRVVFIDETCSLLFDKYFHKGLIKSDCFFVIFCRSSLVGLPLGLDNLYTLARTNEGIVLKHVADSKALNKEALSEPFSQCWVEDGRSFFDYLNDRFDNVFSLSSKDAQLQHSSKTLHVVDSLGFGSRYMQLTQLGAFNNYRIYFMPSYEYCIVHTSWFNSIVEWEAPSEDCRNVEDYYSDILYDALSKYLGLSHVRKQKIPCLECINRRKGQFCAYSHRTCDYPAYGVTFFPQDLMIAIESNLPKKLINDSSILPEDQKLNRFGNK